MNNQNVIFYRFDYSNTKGWSRKLSWKKKKTNWISSTLFVHNNFLLIQPIYEMTIDHYSSPRTTSKRLSTYVHKLLRWFRSIYRRIACRKCRESAFFIFHENTRNKLILYYEFIMFNCVKVYYRPEYSAFYA